MFSAHWTSLQFVESSFVYVHERVFFVCVCFYCTFSGGVYQRRCALSRWKHCMTSPTTRAERHSFFLHSDWLSKNAHKLRISIWVARFLSKTYCQAKGCIFQRGSRCKQTNPHTEIKSEREWEREWEWKTFAETTSFQCNSISWQ